MSKGGATRIAARLAAVQALYQMDVAGKGILETMSEFESHWIGREVDGIDAGAADRGFFRDLVSGVLREQAVIDRTLDETLAENWRLSRLEAVSRAILRAGAYELSFRRDVSVASTIAAYLEVAGGFHGEAETKFINGALDAVARRLRADEMKPKAQIR
ncbi:NusB antitermination factor [Rhizobiales bacterium GAS191]|nr:NusB antitermination factor [Rhizobiales bacterium GAS191]